VKAIKQVIQHQQPEPQNSIPKIQNPKSEILFPKMIFVEESSNYNGRAIKDFWIGQYPVTNEEYACFLNNYKSDTVKAGEYKGQTMIEAHAWGVQQENEQWQTAKGYERHPVICVSWYGANEYCNWLKITTGENYQLPNEWYWEWVARGGKKSKNYEYAGSNNLNEVGWYDRNSGRKTHQVGELNANELGLYDMSGNVWEWCENYDASTSTRAVRGGSWSYIANVCRSSFRDRGNPFDTNVNLGFRVVRC
jgi:formylglycine-generating enzyme required for sulfatase activity